MVSLDRLRKCPEEIGEGFWPPDAKSSRKKRKLPCPVVSSDQQPAATSVSSDQKSQSRGQRSTAAPRQQDPTTTSTAEAVTVPDSGGGTGYMKSGDSAQDAVSASHHQEQYTSIRGEQRPLISKWAGRL